MAWWQAPQSAEGVAVPSGKSFDGVTAAGAGAGGGGAGGAGLRGEGGGGRGGGWGGGGGCRRGWTGLGGRGSSDEGEGEEDDLHGVSMGRWRGSSRWRRYGSGVTVSASKWVSESALVQTPARPASEKVRSVASRIRSPSQWTVSRSPRASSV